MQLTSFCRFILVVVIPVFFSAAVTKAQNFAVSKPGVLLPGTATDKAISMAGGDGHFFIAFRQKGTGAIMCSYLGRHYDTATKAAAAVVPGALSDFGPALVHAGKRIYIFWIAKSGALNYASNSSETAFENSEVHSVNFSTPVQFSIGLSAAVVNDKIVVASHTAKKNEMVCTVLTPAADGKVADAVVTALPDVSVGYPAVAAIDNSNARFCWRAANNNIKYADYNLANSQWSSAVVIPKAFTKTSPALYQILAKQNFFYAWSGTKSDTRLNYAAAPENEQPLRTSTLPGYFNTDYPAAICNVDDNNFLLAFTGADNAIYLSSASSYTPTRWMEQLLHPRTSNKTLKDIVIPGAHDAGMSVLTATGGQQAGTINECNTLTQQLNIGQQLNAGIRMFDLRVGTYNGSLFTKHCASDCMADAIGGGYGESVQSICKAIRQFLIKNLQEIVVLSFSHFCEKETTMTALKNSLLQLIGKELVYVADAASIGAVPLSKLAGKVVLSFETEKNDDKYFPNCSIADQSATFINFRRAYAATNDIKKLVATEADFFKQVDAGVAQNDLVRLDWQLTQSASEAPTICNDFQSDKLSPLVNGAMLLANVIKKNKSIIDHSLDGNKYLPITLDKWIEEGTVHKKNRPNILYVDVAGTWITDYCIDLNLSELYR
jgi:hypothetical protein